MASACRSAAMAVVKSVTARSKTSLPKILPPKPAPSSLFSSSSSRAIPRPASRIASVLGSVESMMPLHSAIASARLRSCIAANSTCWSWLSHDFAVPR